jgi:hypothetical protein
MLLQETFPELAKEMYADLRKLKRLDLAEQISMLQIIDRCRCGLEGCGTFYTELTPNRRSRSGVDMTLQCGATVTELRGTIVRVETLDPTVEATLRRLVP